MRIIKKVWYGYININIFVCNILNCAIKSKHVKIKDRASSCFKNGKMSKQSDMVGPKYPKSHNYPSTRPPYQPQACLPNGDHQAQQQPVPAPVQNPATHQNVQVVKPHRNRKLLRRKRMFKFLKRSIKMVQG